MLTMFCSFLRKTTAAAEIASVLFISNRFLHFLLVKTFIRKEFSLLLFSVQNLCSHWHQLSYRLGFHRSVLVT